MSAQVSHPWLLRGEPAHWSAPFLCTWCPWWLSLFRLQTLSPQWAAVELGHLASTGSGFFGFPAWGGCAAVPCCSACRGLDRIPGDISHQRLKPSGPLSYAHVVLGDP